MVDRIEAFAAKLGDSSIEPRIKVNHAVELRDNVEMLTGSGLYPSFLKNLLPVFIKILEGAPAFASHDPIQKLRNSILDTIHRLPLSPSEVLKPYVSILVDALMHLVRVDNEDNVTMCMKIIMDLQRTQVEATSDKVQPFLDLIQEMFDGMTQAVKDAFDAPTQATAPGASAAARSQLFNSPRPASPAASGNLDLNLDQQTSKQLTPGMQSFKVIAECPILVVSLFQAHRSIVPNNVRKFVPLIKGALLAQAKPQQQAHEEAEKSGEIFTGVSKDIKNRAVFGDFITAQVKTMSFLAYLLRQYAKQLDDFLPSLPNICIRMLRDCPGEKSATRKELLVAIRHIINFNFRGIFSTKVDDLLDERTLIGDGLTVYETMRPLAYSMLADLIHHVRDKLTTDQIRRTIELFSKNMLDDFPGTSFQTMSAKLLLNMADSISALENKQDARHFLVMILRAIAEKFALMNREYDNAVKLSKFFEKQRAAGITVEDNRVDADSPPDWDETDIFFATPIKTSIPRDSGVNPVEDNKFLFKNLMSGLKNMFFRLRATNPDSVRVDPANAPANWNEISFGYKAEEIEVITKLFHEGAKVFRYYSLEPPVNETQYTSPIEYWANFYMVQSSKEERELLETFATVFHSVDPAAFYEVFQAQIPELYEITFEHTALLHIPQFFLASEATSPSFCGMLLQFLMDKIEEVGSSEIKRSSILLRMFKLSFMAVTLFSQQNEQVLLPHVTKLLTKSIELSTTAEEPMNYFYLLRSLFRSIGGGRFELLYKEILPLLEMLLEVLNNLLNAATKPQERHLYVELCLTVPARLSNLLPHLSYLMRPLVVALRADTDLVGQGLRTLELCVDNLTADYLDPIMAPVMDDLMQALWDHLRPAPYSPFHSHTTMRILGKLGGRNRKFLTGPPSLQFIQYADDLPSFDMRLIGSSKDRALQSNIGIDLAILRLRDVPKTPSMKKADPFYKEQAFRYISAQIKAHIGVDSLPDNFPQLVRLYAMDLLEKKFDVAADVMDRTERSRSIGKRKSQEEDLKKLLKACLFAVTLPDLKEPAQALLADICNHFALLDIGYYMANAKHKLKPFDVKAGEGPLCLDSKVLAQALVETLSSDSEEVRSTAETALRHMYDASHVIFGTTEKADRLPFFSLVAKIFCHSCYQEEWFIKAGGALGIDLLTQLPLRDAWLSDRQVEFVKALMFLIKDIPLDLPIRTRLQALTTMEAIMKRCCKTATKADLTDHQSGLFHLTLHVSIELSHMNKHVREAAQTGLKIIASLLEIEVHEIMAPIKDRLLQPIYNKPLRALPFSIQIGYIEAVTYCLNLQNSIVEFSDQLNRLLLETLALTDADDETLASKPTEYRTAESIVSLRVACLKLLATALFHPELSGQQHANSRNRIVAVFFKSLYSSNIQVIDAAYDGLKAVLNQTNRLPKDLLQNGLRPILMSLQDPKKVNVQTLEGLARLLNLLTTYFKPEIGDRLINHMEAMAKDPAIQKVSFMLIEQNPQMKIVTASLNVFHLLPPQAVSQMPKVIAAVMDFESKLRRTQGTPFREPLYKFLAKYPKEAWDFFSTRLNEKDHGRFFAQVLADPACGPIRELVLTKIDDLLTRTLEAPGNLTTINGINAIYALCKMNSTWLKDKENARTMCLEAGRQLQAKLQKNEMESDLRLLAHLTSERLMEILVFYLERVPEDLDFCFKIIECVTNNELKMQVSLKHFLYNRIICSDSVEYWRNMIMHSIDLYSSRGVKPKMKTFTFHNIVNPILAMDIQRGFKPGTGVGHSALLDRALVDAIHSKIWKAQIVDAGDDQASPGVDHARLELLQMSALLLKYHHSSVSDFRKDLIKFGWSYMKLEDTINKYAAYVLIGFFIYQFESPAKIVREVYFALLKAHQNEGRNLVTQALDLIASALPKRLVTQGERDPKFPTWAKLPKRIISEESSNLQQLIAILHFIIRHPDLFYESREHYIPLMIPSLPKIAAPPNPSNDNKKLVLNVVELIKNWEKRRISAAKASPAPDAAGNRQADGTQDTSQARSTGSRGEYVIPNSLRATLIKYLAQLISTLVERYPVPASKLKEAPTPAHQSTAQGNDICRKAFVLLCDLLSPDYWADLGTDLFPRLTEQVLASERTERTDDKTVTSVVNTLQLVRIIINFKSQEWIQSNIALIQKLLEKPMRMESPEIQDCLHGENREMDNDREITPLIQKILMAMPSESGEEDEMEVDSPPFEFVRFVSTVAGETLAANNLVASINMLWTISIVRPKDIDQHIPLILRALQTKLAKDHVANAAANSQQSAGQQTRPLDQNGDRQDPRQAEIQTQLILKTIDIVSKRMSNLGEQRRPFLSVLASLVDKSFDNRVCEKILGMVETWIFDWNDPFPTLKEKTAVLHKMLNFEARPDPHMLHKFLDLVIRIYEDPKITRTELTVRLEHAFLVGTRANDVSVRNRFMTIFDRSLTRTAPARLSYVLTSQNWDTLAETFWLSQAIQLMLGAVDMNTSAQLHSEDFRLIPASQLYVTPDSRKNDIMIDDQLEGMVAKHRRFFSTVGDIKIRDFLEPLCQMQHTDAETAYKLWVALFPICWASISREDRMELEKGMVSLLTKDFHQRQIDRRPNVVQALLEGAVRSSPRFKVPPHVIKFLSKTYGAWYTALVSLEESTNVPLIDAPLVKESNLDALVETYAGLEEEDLFYGTWRRRCKYVETNAALSYEQNGVWDKAQRLYESAQVKARTAVLPFSQGEYMVWEDHWVVCAQKLQQWDVLYDFAKHENFNDLLLEATYRNFDQWSGAENLEGINSIIKAVSDAPTPRRVFFQAFMALLKFYEKPDTHTELTRISDEAVQLSIRKWHQLPKRITSAHIPILQGFQQLVELTDAQVIFQSLQSTNATNLDTKSQELKLLLGSWRDRLPNVWDDINAWQSLVTWRQHIFNQINKTYLNLIQPSAGNNTGTSFAYRGYHETAWIINRFAHVARKHQLPEVCISQLSKIYTLPNIEIQEAFLKLREQAKCHYQNPSELNNGLDVINNTNLNYFGAQQKAEFYTLKGMFLAKLKQKDDANDAFGTALYYDIRLPKAWAEWGQYNDSKFRSDPDNLEPAFAAVSCYLEAASLFKNAKSRKLLSRILWLLSVDNEDGKVAKAFEDFRGDTPVWYWITFIPQLLTSLSHREAHISRVLLTKIAKNYPQALYFLIRTNREDMMMIKKQTEQKLAQKQKQQQAANVKSENSSQRPGSSSSRPTTANGDTTMTNGAADEKKEDKKEAVANGASGSPKYEEKDKATKTDENDGDESPKPKKPWEHSEEIMQALKTAFPLLALSMETMVDQIQKHFKCPPDEDAYRLIVALLNDGMAYIGRMPAAYAQDYKLPPATENNIRKFAETILPPHIRNSFEEDFVARKPTMYEYIHKLRKWRDKFEEKLDHRSAHQYLELTSQHLTEFRFQKFDEVEIPGQYLLHRDKNQDFIRIDRFLPDVDLVRTVGFSHRRLKIRGHDGSIHTFAVQHPAARHCRREERTIQLFRIFNGVLAKKKETRRRKISFFLPLMIPLAPSIRLVQEDEEYISLQGVFEDHCRRHGLNKDEPMLFIMEKLRAMAELRNHKFPDQVQTLRMEAFTAIQDKWVPKTIALEYVQATYPNFEDFWLFRRQFAYQLAALTFMTYTMHMTTRFPQKMSIARGSGNVWGSELVPSMNQACTFHNSEPVPFRLTPNLQVLMGPIAMEGIYVCSMQAIARSLTEPDGELEQQLSIFVRDEVMWWFTQQHRNGEAQLRERVQHNSEVIVNKTMALAQPPQGPLPSTQTVIDIVSKAVDPMRLAQCDPLWMAYL